MERTPTSNAREAYEDAKQSGADDTTAWWAAYSASPFGFQSNAHADANAAQQAYNEAQRKA